MVVGPAWQGETPSGIKKVFRSSTAFSLVIFRTQLFNPTTCPTSWPCRPATRPSRIRLPAPPGAGSRARNRLPPINAALARKQLLRILDFVMQFGPPAANEATIRADLARIGVGPGKTFDFKDLPPEHKREIVAGLQEGQRKVEAAVL